MSLKIEVADLGLAALDALEADALAVPVGPERPLRGLAGFADWRLCGAISRSVSEGLFVPETVEALLLPSGGRLPVPRVFCFGLGDGPLDGPRFSEAARRVCGALARAGSRTFATALPPCREGPVAAARLWLEGCLSHPFARLVILGDARALARDLALGRQTLSADVEVMAVKQRVELPARGAPFATRGAVVR
jgi:hypothetical protein